MTGKTVAPIMRSLPLAEKLDLPPRAELLPKIESGELEFLDFAATVFVDGPNRNSYRFRANDLPAFAKSFEGQPFLRNHDSGDIDARDGTILASKLDGAAIRQEIRLTTRRGMTDYLEGKIDRFSIGWWDYTDIICSVCNLSFLSPQCVHWPGRSYDTPGGKVLCELTFIEPKGKETSAVNAPAVPGTGIDAALEAKLDVIGLALSALAVKPLPDSTPGQAPAPEPQPQLTFAQARARRLRSAALQTHFYFAHGDTHMENVREMLKARALELEKATALHQLAETEQRDLTAEERQEFSRLMDAVEAFETQIKTLSTERQRLTKAILALDELAAGDPVKPEPAAAQSVEKTRAEFDALTVSEQSAFVKAGGRVIE